MLRLVGIGSLELSSSNPLSDLLAGYMVWLEVNVWEGSSGELKSILMGRRQMDGRGIGPPKRKRDNFLHRALEGLG